MRIGAPAACLACTVIAIGCGVALLHLLLLIAEPYEHVGSVEFVASGALETGPSSNSMALRLERGRADQPASGHDPKMTIDLRQRLMNYNLSSSLSSDVPKVFADVILVVQFNTNGKEMFADAPALRAIYGELFDEIVFVGSVVQIGGSYGPENPFGVLICPGSEYGFMPYNCLTEVMMRWPGRAGYMQLHYDVLLNWPAVAALPRDSLWVMGQYLMEDNAEFVPYCHSWFPNDLANPAVPYFDWWYFDLINGVTQRNLGKHAIREFLEFSPKWLQENYHQQCEWTCNYLVGHKPESPDRHHKRRCATTCQAPHLFPGAGMGDVAYIPAKHVEEFKILSNVAFRANLLIELAFPAILCGMRLPKNRDILQLIGVPNHGGGATRTPNWDRHYSFHKNPMHDPIGLQSIRDMVQATVGGSRPKLPYYGWAFIEEDA